MQTASSRIWTCVNNSISYYMMYAILKIKSSVKISLVWFISLMVYQHLMGYLMPRFDSFVNVWLQSLLTFNVSLHLKKKPKTSTFLFVYLDWPIGLVGKVFTNGPGIWCSIPDKVIPKTQKMVLDTSLLNTQHLRYISRVKWSNPRKGVVPSLTPQCSSYWKGSLQVTLDYSYQLYLLTFYNHLLAQ